MKDNSRNRLANFCARKWHGKYVENRTWTDKAKQPQLKQNKRIKFNQIDFLLTITIALSATAAAPTELSALAFLRGLRCHRHWDIDIIFSSSIIDSKSLAIFGAGSAQRRSGEPQPEPLPVPQAKAEPEPRPKTQPETLNAADKQRMLISSSRPSCDCDCDRDGDGELILTVA